VSGAGPVREQPHGLLAPTSAGHERRRCGGPRGAPFPPTRPLRRDLAGARAVSRERAEAGAATRYRFSNQF